MDPNDPSLRSWIDVPPGSDFPLQNLPFGVFRRPTDEQPRVGTRVGDTVIDLKALEHAGVFRDTSLGDDHVFCKRALNKFLSKGRRAWREARSRVSELLRADQSGLRDDAELRRAALVPVSGVQMLLPIEPRGFVDFYASREHATNVGIMFRGAENALMPNWLHMPIAYNGRASSLLVSGAEVLRPMGQTKADDADRPTFGPSRSLDFELELGFVVGAGSELGTRVAADQAFEHVFGVVLLNDWSARDIQRWEYQPLGPFLGKSFATSISPWVVTLDALTPFFVAPPAQDPPVLAYLRTTGDTAIDLRLEVWLQSAAMAAPARISATEFRGMYWTWPQMVAHMTVNGCNLVAGDIFGSGTVSGPAPESRGSLLELAWKGTKPIRLPGGEERRFLHDGDTVILRGWCERPGIRIGLGEVRGTIREAVPPHG